MLDILIHGPVATDLRELSALLDEPCFALTARETDRPSWQRRVYEQLRAVNRWAGSGRALIGDRGRLFGTLSFAATVSPALFNVAQAHYGVCLRTIEALRAPSAELDRIVGEIDSLGSVAAIIFTEVGVGCSHFAVETRADFDARTGDFVLTTPHPAASKFMANVGLDGVARTGVVYAQLWSNGQCHGLYPFVVPLRSETDVHPGIHIHTLEGDSVLKLDYALVRFDGVRVPQTCWLRDDATIDASGHVNDPLGGGEKRMLRSLTAGGNAFAAGTVGAAAAARACVWTALRYAAQRRTAARMGRGRVLLDFRNQQQHLFTALAEAYVVSALAQAIVDGRDSAGKASAVATVPWTAIDQMASLGKAVAVAGALEVVQACRRASGAHGALGANRFREYEDLVIAYGSAGGDNQLILIEVGRTLAAGPAVPDVAMPAVLDGTVALCQLAQWEVRRQYERASADLAQATQASDDLYAVWNERLPAVIDLARAHGRRIALECLLGTEAALAGSEVAVLHAVGTIYAVTHFGGGLAYATRDRVLADAFAIVADNLEPMLAAFNLSPEMIDAPMAQDDYVAAYVSGLG